MTNDAKSSALKTAIIFAEFINIRLIEKAHGYPLGKIEWGDRGP